MKRNILTYDEMRENEIMTSNYQLNLTPGSFFGRFCFLAQGAKGTLRAFFEFDDGRRIFALLQYFNNYLDIMAIPDGSRIKISYAQIKNGVYPERIELISSETPTAENEV